MENDRRYQEQRGVRRVPHDGQPWQEENRGGGGGYRPAPTTNHPNQGYSNKGYEGPDDKDVSPAQYISDSFSFLDNIADPSKPKSSEDPPSPPRVGFEESAKVEMPEEGETFLRHRRTASRGRSVKGVALPSRSRPVSAHGMTMDDELDKLLQAAREKGTTPTARQMAELHRSQLQAGKAKKRLSGYAAWKYRQSVSWKRNKLRFRDAFSNFEVWRGSFKVIEGQFGSAVLSYFKFLKWLILLNLLITLLVMGVTTVPQLIIKPFLFNQTINSTGFAPINWSAPVEMSNQGAGQVLTPVNLSVNGSQTNGSIIITANMSYVEQAYQCSAEYEKYITSTLRERSIPLLIVDLLQGTGWMENTILFYGFYFNKTSPTTDVKYQMPLGYMLVTVAYFFISLILMVTSTGQGVKENLALREDKFYRYCNKVFCGWDYCITDEKSAKLKNQYLEKEFVNDIAEERRNVRRKNLTTGEKFQLYTIRIMVNVVVLFILAGAAWLIIWTTLQSLELSTSPQVMGNSILQLLVQFMPSFTITVLNIIIPEMFLKVVTPEDYSPEFEIRVTLIRTVFLKLASLGVLIGTTYNQVIACGGKDITKTCNTCTDKNVWCWETYLGQQIYKLVILDFVVIVAITLFVEFPRKICVTKFQRYKLFQFVGQQEFEVPKNVLDIVYSQALCWLGAFFSPLIPIMTLVKLFIFFYLKKLSLLQNCLPSSRPYRTSRTNTFFMIVLFLTFILCSACVIYVVGEIHPSQSCGPFRIYNEEKFVMFRVISDMINGFPEEVSKIFKVLGSPTVYIPITIFLCLVMYYYWAVTRGHKRMIELLKEQLALEGKDKQFLLMRVQEAVSRGEILNS